MHTLSESNLVTAEPSWRLEAGRVDFDWAGVKEVVADEPRRATEAATPVEMPRLAAADFASARTEAFILGGSGRVVGWVGLAAARWRSVGKAHSESATLSHTEFSHALPFFCLLACLLISPMSHGTDSRSTADGLA